MRTRLFFPLAALAVAASLAACGSSGSSSSTSSSGGGSSCNGVAGKQIVVLKDDKELQQAENIVPLARSGSQSSMILTAVDKVSAVLDTEALQALNSSTDIDRNTPNAAAQSFVTKNNLTSGLPKGSGSVTVYSQSFNENLTIGYIYFDVLKAAGYDVGSKVKAVDARANYLAAMTRSSSAAVVPDYLGSLTAMLNQQQNGANAASQASGDVQKTLVNLKKLAAKDKLVVGTPAGAQDQNVFGVTDAFAKQYKISTLSGLAKACPGGVVLGADPACNTSQQPLCAPGIKKTYGITVSKFVGTGTAGSQTTKTYLESGRTTLGLLLSSDPTLKQASS